MKEKSFIPICIILISLFVSPNLLSAEDIKINKIDEKNYKIQELKTNFLKADTKKIPVIGFKTKSSGMSKGSATLLGVGAGLVVGAGTGYLIGGSLPSSSDSEQKGWNQLGGAVIGGLSGLVIGGVTGYILGK